MKESAMAKITWSYSPCYPSDMAAQFENLRPLNPESRKKNCIGCRHVYSNQISHFFLTKCGGFTECIVLFFAEGEKNQGFLEQRVAEASSLCLPL